MSKLLKDLSFEIKEVQGDDDFYYIKGYASTPDVDRSEDIVVQSALLESVQRIGKPAFMHQHNMKAMPLGVCTDVTQEQNMTIVDLKMPKNDETAKVKQLAEMGAYQGLSIGFVPKKCDYNENGIRIIKELDWYEISLVTVPCNPNARLIQVKSQEKLECDIMNDIKTIRDAEKFLIDAGCSKKEAGYVISMIKSSAQGEPSEDEGKGEPSQSEQEQEQKDIEALLDLRNSLKTKV